MSENLRFDSNLKTQLKGLSRFNRVSTRTGARLTVFLVVIYVMNLGCANIFLEMADKRTDEALLYSAKMKMDNYDWSGAITDITATSAEFQTRRDVRTILASAYAGRCGLDFIDLANKIQNAGATSFMAVLLSAFAGKTATHLADCISAEDTLKLIGATAVRNSEENMLMAFVSLAKIGVILSVRADQVDGNGVVDAAWSPCDAVEATGEDPAHLPDTAANRADATEMTVSLGLFMLSLAQAGAGGSGGDTFTEISNNCTTLEDPPYSLAGFCDNEARADVTLPEAAGLRAAVMDNSNFGFAITNNGPCALGTCYSVNCLQYQD